MAALQPQAVGLDLDNLRGLRAMLADSGSKESDPMIPYALQPGRLDQIRARTTGREAPTPASDVLDLRALIEAVEYLQSPEVGKSARDIGDLLQINMETLTDDQRLEILLDLGSAFCSDCGRKQPDGVRCQCENDE